jgi:hypothetical protein
MVSQAAAIAIATFIEVTGQVGQTTVVLPQSQADKRPKKAVEINFFM